MLLKMNTIEGIICCLAMCSHISQDIDGLKSHLKLYHALSLSETQDDKFECKDMYCSKSYSRIASFIKHLESQHIQKDGKFQFKYSVPPKNENLQEKSKNELKKIEIDGLMSKMIADLRFSTTITGADLGRCIESTERIVSNVLDQVQTNVGDFLKIKGFDDEETETFIDTLKLNESFAKYKTMNSQIKAMKTHYTFIDSKEISFNNTDGSKEATFQYISIIETLKLVLTNNEVWNFVKGGSKRREDEFMRGFEDTNTYRNHPFFKKFSEAFGINIYFDEFLVNNPLGSKTHGNKIGALYFSISNLPTHLRDFLGNVHVIAFGYANDIVTYGMNKFLLPFIMELKQLESDNGVKVVIKNSFHTLRATLLGVCADSLAAHELLGFMSPSAKYFCRLCMMSSNDRKTCIHKIAPRRTREDHMRHLEKILENEKARSEYGVKFDTILNELLYFYCTNNWIMDIMHDMLEGQGHFDLKLVIFSLIKKYKEITVALLNSRIRAFNYGREESKNKPSATLTVNSINNVFTDHKLQQRAVQMWCFLRVFPFLVADIVAPDDEYLLHIVNLNKIIEYIFSPKIKQSNLVQLNELINQHIQNFCSLFPEANPINKLHHFQHFVECILKSGPLRPLSCLKYEAKHQMFKKYGSICCNFKNILVSMANISQMSQCSIWGTNKSEIRPRLEHNVSGEIINDIETIIKEQMALKGLQVNAGSKLVSKISVYGIKYAVGSFVLYKCDPYNLNMPMFGKIDQIILHNDDVYLYCKKYKSKYLSESLNSYCVEEDKNYEIIRVDELLDDKPFSIWTTFSPNDTREFICPRYLIF